MYKIIALEPWEVENNRPALDDNDNCYYYMTYDPWSILEENKAKQIVLNLKISRQDIIKNPKRAKYKQESIKVIAGWLVDTIKNNPVLIDYLWIPAPPSKTPTDIEYDDRLVKILMIVKQQIPKFIFFDALYLKESVQESHRSNIRDIQTKLRNLGIDQIFMTALNKKQVVVFDDVLTTGATFKSAKLKIKEIDNALKVIGIFIAKAISNENSLSEL